MRFLLFYSAKPGSQVRILIYRNWSIAQWKILSCCATLDDLLFVSIHLDPPGPSADPDATLDEDNEPEQDSGLLSGRYFTVAGFADEHLEHLWQIIESNGGKHVGDRQMADYAVFPMNSVPGDNFQAKQLVSHTVLHLINSATTN